ncbi:epidermal growth factor receptor kinase substrate 8-like protein 1 [Neolamprologus brichardi]|uniref:epidermal growth factor receptor kinase substrate 8-like protein 1 n=1 Tax=Neolamprologus brichardi TaxID=32507 RepID=UPI001643A09F|nr:epidermal growth factor receptor kinase substrate 8-like protein 1 [Neolamprologus brichardi]
MTNITRHIVTHLLTFSLQNGEVQSVEEAQNRLSFLAQNKKLWSQQMYLDVGTGGIYLRDVQSQDELESYAFRSIFRCQAVNTEKHFPSLLMLVCQGDDQKKPDIHFFNCETVKAQQICDEVTLALRTFLFKGHVKGRDMWLQSGGDMFDPYNIPSPPMLHAPNPPPVNPPPYPGPRANGGPDISFLRAEREVGILNHCFDEIEAFMGKLQQTAEAATVLNQRKKKKKKSKKQSAEGFLDLLLHLWFDVGLSGRRMMVKTTGGPAFGAAISSPALTSSAVSLLQDTLTEEERQLWTSLGPNWTHPRSQLRGPVAPYTPVFFDGWKPEALKPDGQVWEDPVESQHKLEALREKQEVPAAPPLSKNVTLAPPTPPALPKTTPTHSPQRPRSLPSYNQHVQAVEDNDKVTLVNDELLQRLTNGKSNMNKPLVIPRSADTSLPLDYHSPPEEVAEWLRGKGFSKPTVSCLGVLTGAQLFSLNKEELKAVIPEEGARVYSQLAVQKSLLEVSEKRTAISFKGKPYQRLQY